MKLTIKNLGEVPSFKNTKMITRGRLITNPRKQKWMDAASEHLACQLRSYFQAQGIPTLTGEHLLSAIASLMPLDDSRTWIANLSVSWRRVSKGQEGAEIEIVPHVI